MTFDNKTILITGASTGIGKALAEKLSHIKCNLILTARRIELLEELRRNLKGDKAEIFIFKNDVSNKEDVRQSMIKIKNDIDIAILNAGVGRTINPENYNSEDGETVYCTNVLGLIYWIEVLLPQMKERKSGIIAGVSSLADNRGYPGSSFYCGSKAAASVMLEGLRVEFIKYGIKVITIKPGFVATPMTANHKFHMPFLMDADKAADIIIKGINREKKVIQFPWQTVLGAKLVSMIPNFIFDKLVKKQIGQ